MLAKFLLLFVFLLHSTWAFAQKPAKSAKDLSKRFVAGLQTKNKDAIASLYAPPATYKLFAPHLKQMSDTEIADMLKNDVNSLDRKIDALFSNLEQFGISEKEIQWISAKETPLNAVAPNYFGLPIAVRYKNTSDTILIDVFKDKKNWYIVDIAKIQDKQPFTKIITKHSEYSWSQFYEMALSQIKDKKYEAAFKNLESAEFLSPQSPEIYLQRGNIYNAQKDVFNALEMYRKAYQVNPDYMPAYFEAAVLSFNNPEIADEAIYNFEICLEKEYEVLVCSKYLLDIYLKQVADFEQDPYVEASYLKNSYEKVLSTANRIIEKEEELNTEEKIKVYLARAGSLMDMGKHNEARNDFEKVLSIDAANTTALYELAWIENETKSYTKALDYAKKAYELNKNNGEILAELAFAKMQTKDYRGAVEDYTKLFTLGKEFQTAKKYQNRGDCYKALKNNKMACADYKKAVEFGADDSTVQEWLKKNCK